MVLLVPDISSLAALSTGKNMFSSSGYDTKVFVLV